MKLLIDMNLSPHLVERLAVAGHDAVHWSAVGDPRASDHEILEWARTHRCTLLTHDLDFGAILAATQTQSPSVLQVRTEDVSPAHIAPILLSAIRRHESHLTRGALVTCDETSQRVHILPLS